MFASRIQGRDPWCRIPEQGISGQQIWPLLRREPWPRQTQGREIRGPGSGRVIHLQDLSAPDERNIADPEARDPGKENQGCGKDRKRFLSRSQRDIKYGGTKFWIRPCEWSRSLERDREKLNSEMLCLSSAFPSLFPFKGRCCLLLLHSLVFRTNSTFELVSQVSFPAGRRKQQISLKQHARKKKKNLLRKFAVLARSLVPIVV